MHEDAARFVRWMWNRAIDQTQVKHILEIGSYNVNGSIRGIIQKPHHLYVGIDVRPGQDVDIVANGATFTYPVPFDLICCCGTLEHTPEVDGIVTNAYRLLRPGGTFLMTCAGEGWQEHTIDGSLSLKGEYYANVKKQDIDRLLKPFSSAFLLHDPVTFDLYALAVK